MTSRERRGWIVYVVSCLFISLLGTLFLLFDKKIFIPGFINESHDIVVNGWPIVVIGIVCLLFGVLIKWSINNEKDRSSVVGEPPRTELVEKK